MHVKPCPPLVSENSSRATGLHEVRLLSCRSPCYSGGTISPPYQKAWRLCKFLAHVYTCNSPAFPCRVSVKPCVGLVRVDLVPSAAVPILVCNLEIRMSLAFLVSRDVYRTSGISVRPIAILLGLLGWHSSLLIVPRVIVLALNLMAAILEFIVRSYSLYCSIYDRPFAGIHGGCA